MYVLVHVCRAHLPGAWFVFDPVLEIRPIIRLPKQDQLTCNASTHTQKLCWDRSCDPAPPDHQLHLVVPILYVAVLRWERGISSMRSGGWARSMGTWYGRLHQDHEEGLTCDNILTTSSVEADLLTSACFLQFSLLYQCTVLINGSREKLSACLCLFLR